MQIKQNIYKCHKYLADAVSFHVKFFCPDTEEIRNDVESGLYDSGFHWVIDETLEFLSGGYVTQGAKPGGKYETVVGLDERDYRKSLGRERCPHCSEDPLSGRMWVCVQMPNDLSILITHKAQIIAQAKEVLLRMCEAIGLDAPELIAIDDETRAWAKPWERD